MEKLKILVVEDDIDVLDFVKCGLDKMGMEYELETISDGEEFKSKFGGLHADLAILDLMMPGITGFDICGIIRKNPRLAKTKILAMTGYDTPENKQKILKAGADDYIPKPFELADLTAKIGGLLEEINK